MTVDRSTKSWEQFHTDVLALADSFAEYKPDIICPVMLGGLIPGTIIAKKLEINDVRPIDIEREGLERRLAYDVQGNIAGKQVLIVEDDLIYGLGPATIKKIFEERGAIVKIAALYIQPQAVQIADFYVEVCDVNPNYPWKNFNDGDKIR